MASDVAYGCLDESPSLNDGSTFFCVGIIVNKDIDIRPFKHIFKRARQIINKKKSDVSEIKFSKSIDKVRKIVLKEIANQKIKAVILAVDRNRRKIDDTPENYGIIVGYAGSLVLKYYPKLLLTVDKKFTKENDNKAMTTAALMVTSKKSTTGFLAFQPPADSQSNVMIQVADFIAGALHQKYNLKNDSYWELIRKIILVEKKISWVDLAQIKKSG